MSALDNSSSYSLPLICIYDLIALLTDKMYDLKFYVYIQIESEIFSIDLCWVPPDYNQYFSECLGISS